MGWEEELRHLHVKQEEKETDSEVALDNPRNTFIMYVSKISSTSRNANRLPG